MKLKINKYNICLRQTFSLRLSSEVRNSREATTELFQLGKIRTPTPDAFVAHTRYGTDCPDEKSLDPSTLFQILRPSLRTEGA